MKTNLIKKKHSYIIIPDTSRAAQKKHKVLQHVIWIGSLIKEFCV